MLREIISVLESSVLYTTPKHLFPKGKDKNEYVEVTFEMEGENYSILMGYPISTTRLTPALSAQKNWKILPQKLQKTYSGSSMSEYTAEPKRWEKVLKNRGASNIKFDYTNTNKR